jgi:hypothetical protein
VYSDSGEQQGSVVKCTLVLQLIKLFALQLRCARNQHRASLPALQLALQLAVQLALNDQRAAAAK